MKVQILNFLTDETKKPIIVTMGEPSGISSEIIIKTWLKRKSLNVPKFILIDDLTKLKKLIIFLIYKPIFKLSKKQKMLLKFLIYHYLLI